ncbi:hypothetical protein HDU97_008597 [Phlyctochytrium planicorne]|nr:hypothetical protein HDU97_008597 [Phlyctochytrium planicorne]
MSLILKACSDAGSPQMAEMMDSFASMLTEKEKERERMMERIHFVSMYPLKSYTQLCQKLRDEVKSRESTIDREHKKQQQLDKIMIKESNNRPKISQVQMELITATHEVSEVTDHLMDSVRKFEEQKRVDLKTSLSEMMWSLEILSRYHREFANIEFDSEDHYIEDLIEGASGKSQSAPPSPTSAVSQSPMSPNSPDSPVSPVSPTSPTSPFKKGR